MQQVLPTSGKEPDWPRQIDVAELCRYVPSMVSADTQFTPDNASAMAQRPRRPRGPRALRQLVAMQDNLYNLALEPSVSATARAKCALAWERLEERKRVLRGKPLPGSLKPLARVK